MKRRLGGSMLDLMKMLGVLSWAGADVVPGARRVPSERSQRSPELVGELQDAAEDKRYRKALKLHRDAYRRDTHYHLAPFSPRDCFQLYISGVRT